MYEFLTLVLSQTKHLLNKINVSTFVNKPFFDFVKHKNPFINVEHSNTIDIVEQANPFGVSGLIGDIGPDDQFGNMDADLPVVNGVDALYDVVVFNPIIDEIIIDLVEDLIGVGIHNSAMDDLWANNVSQNVSFHNNTIQAQHVDNLYFWGNNSVQPSVVETEL